MKPGISFNIKQKKSGREGWIPSFPNPADFRFDYCKLMQESQRGLASLPPSDRKKKVAVIGAGAAGMTAARELHRCGFEVTIFEASDRIGGRLYTKDNPVGDSQAGMEMGAMRMPFFNTPGDNESQYQVDDPNHQNSLLGYYLNYEAAAKGHPANLETFPNPGLAPGNTGIYLNRGYGPDLTYEEPKLIQWPKDGVPDDPELKKLNEKVDEFGKKFLIAAEAYYTKNTDEWPNCWKKIIQYYQPMTFNNLVMAPAMDEEEIRSTLSDLSIFDGNLGGFGMTSAEAEILYTIGIGDGSWGAFYSIRRFGSCGAPISALVPIFKQWRD